MPACILCDINLVQPGTALDCGCTEFHDQCFREYLLACKTMDAKTTCPVCMQKQPLSDDDKEALLLFTGQAGLLLWRRTDDLDFLLALAGKNAKAAFRVSTEKARQDPRLARIFCQKLRGYIPGRFLPPLSVAAEMRILTHALCRRYMRAGHDFLLLPAKFRRRVDTAVAAVKLKPSLYASLDEPLASNRRVIDAAVYADGMAVQHVKEASVDLKLALAAVRQCGGALGVLPPAWRDHHQVQVAACRKDPSAVLLIPKANRNPLAHVVLEQDGGLVGAFDGLSPETEKVAIRCSPAPAVLELRRRWATAVRCAPIEVVLAARAAGAQMPLRCEAFAVSRHPQRLWCEDMPSVCKKVAIICGYAPPVGFGCEELAAFFVRYSPLKRPLRLHQAFRSRELARLAVSRFGPSNLFGNEDHFSARDTAELAGREGLFLPLCPDEPPPDHPVFEDPLTRFRWFGQRAVPRWAETKGFVDYLICSPPCMFNRSSLLRTWDTLGRVEKKASVYKYPGLLLTIPHEERLDMALAALTSPTLCRGLVFAESVIRTVMAAIPPDQRAAIIKEHPEYAEFVPPFKAPKKPHRPTRAPPPPPPPQSPCHLLRQMRQDLCRALARSVPSHMKRHAYALVDADTTRRCLDLIALRFPPTTEEDARFLLQKGRMPSVLPSLPLRLTIPEMQLLVSADLRLAAEMCETRPEALKFFLRKNQYHILRRLVPSQFEQVLVHVNALPTLRSLSRRSPAESPRALSSTAETCK